MLQHAAGYVLANEGTDARLVQAFLGHADIRHTALSPKRQAAVNGVSAVTGDRKGPLPGDLTEGGATCATYRETAVRPKPLRAVGELALGLSWRLGSPSRPVATRRGPWQ
jgi:hypothetical protein